MLFACVSVLHIDASMNVINFAHVRHMFAFRHRNTWTFSFKDAREGGREPIGLDGEVRRRRINPGLKESRRPAPAWQLTRGTHVNMLMLAQSHYQRLICRVYLPFVCKGFVRSNFMNAMLIAVNKRDMSVHADDQQPACFLEMKVSQVFGRSAAAMLPWRAR